MESNLSPRRKKLRRMVVVLAGTALWAAVLFIAAGRLDWTAGWVYITVSVLALVATGLIVNKLNPGVIAARGERHEGTKPFDKVFAALYVPALYLGLPVVAGLDAVRYGWAPLPYSVLPLGVVLHLVSMVPVTWAMAINPHLETTVRIQTDRGHRVITTGPYRWVRHPMYAGAILQFLAAPLILGSTWAYAASAVLVGLMVVRTGLEDATLRRELPGYPAYAEATRFRLLPGVW